jgi:hypothetical protein
MHTYPRNPLLVYIKRTKQEKRQGEESWRRKKEIKREACIFSYSCWDMWAAAALVLAAAGPEMPVLLLLLLARGITGSARGLQLKGRRRFTLSTRFTCAIEKEEMRV